MKKNEINICFCTDKKLIDFLPTVINSIMRKNQDNEIKVHIISTDDADFSDTIKYINSIPNFEATRYHKQWDLSYKGLPHVSKATMVRLYIPELLECDKVIYLDIDVIVNLNLYELYNVDCGETGIALKNSINQTWEKFFDPNSGKKSGNCGIIVMNFETLRKNNFTQKCLKIHAKNQDRHDQYVINMYADGNHTVLEPRFNIFHRQDDHLVDEKSDYIFHYAGPKKPYFHNTGKYQYLWDENRKRISKAQYKKLWSKLKRMNFGVPWK